MEKPANFERTVLFIAKSLQGHQYAFRGTASLVLQGLEMNIDDIDILCDRETALACSEILKSYLLEEVSFKESPRFKSYYGKFKVNEVEVEVMGDWQIKEKDGSWSAPFSATGGERKQINVSGRSVYVTTIETELFVFAKMGRWTAYQKIKRQLPAEEKDPNQLKLLT